MSLPPLRAPREHGSVLAQPPLDQVASLLARNHDLLTTAPIEVLGRPLASLRLLTRREAAQAAAAYFQEAGEPAPPRQSGQHWIVAGHQPELFHPGVWFKNFAMCGLAARHGAFSLNLVIDNDLAKPALLRLPAGQRIAKLPFDHGRGETPYEERVVLDESLFASLPGQATPFVAEWPFTPLLADLWSAALAQVRRTRLLGERLAAARRTMERRWQCHQYELPLSRLCRTEAFAWFAGHLLEHLPRLNNIYNGTVHDYRRRHDLRSANHPVPDLARQDDWFEAPLWGWRPGQARRGRIFCRHAATGTELRADGVAWPSLPRPSAASFIGAWRRLEEQGFKVRTRALTTTLFTRLCLADLFIHGIGGGKYDELTDTLLVRFFELPQAPAFLVLSATLLLPLPHHAGAVDQCRQLAQQARDAWWNPQRHLDALPAARPALQEKQAWIDRPCATHAERLERFLALRRINDALRVHAGGERERLRRAAHECQAHVAANAVADRRDYSFCLYPEGMLREFYGRFL